MHAINVFKGFALQNRAVFVYTSVNFEILYSKHTVEDQEKKKKKKKSRTFLQGRDTVSKQHRVRKTLKPSSVFENRWNWPVWTQCFLGKLITVFIKA